jgi:uncharacterized protein (TIGR03067 family)
MSRACPRVVLLAGLALGLLPLALAARGGDAKKDREQLQGTWRLTRVLAKGEEVPPKLFEGGTMLVEGDVMTTVTRSAGKEVRQKGKYKLDPAKKPREIDVVSEEGSDKGAKVLGIYDLQGDTLKLALNKDKRPTEFTATEKSTTVVFVFRRAQK